MIFLKDKLKSFGSSGWGIDSFGFYYYAVIKYIIFKQLE